MGGEFREAGYVNRLDEDRVGIHIGPFPETVTYEITTETAHQVLMYGAHCEILRRIPQTQLDPFGSHEALLQRAGTITLSRTRVTVTVRPKDGRLYVINADALRDVMHGKIPKAAVSEAIFRKPESNKQATLA